MSLLMLTAFVHARTAHLLIVDALDDLLDDLLNDRSRRLAGDTGQATTEYALVLLAAAMVALLVIAWATAGGGGERIGRLFNRDIDSVIDRV